MVSAYNDVPKNDEFMYDRYLLAEIRDRDLNDDLNITASPTGLPTTAPTHSPTIKCTCVDESEPDPLINNVNSQPTISLYVLIGAVAGIILMAIPVSIFFYILGKKHGKKQKKLDVFKHLSRPMLDDDTTKTKVRAHGVGSVQLYDIRDLSFNDGPQNLGADEGEKEKSAGQLFKAGKPTGGRGRFFSNARDSMRMTNLSSKHTNNNNINAQNSIGMTLPDPLNRLTDMTAANNNFDLRDTVASATIRSDHDDHENEVLSVASISPAPVRPTPPIPPPGMGATKARSPPVAPPPGMEGKKSTSILNSSWINKPKEGARQRSKHNNWLNISQMSFSKAKMGLKLGHQPNERSTEFVKNANAKLGQGSNVWKLFDSETNIQINPQNDVVSRKNGAVRPENEEDFDDSESN